MKRLTRSPMRALGVALLFLCIACASGHSVQRGASGTESEGVDPGIAAETTSCSLTLAHSGWGEGPGFFRIYLAADATGRVLWSEKGADGHTAYFIGTVPGGRVRDAVRFVDTAIPFGERDRILHDDNIPDCSPYSLLVSAGARRLEAHTARIEQKYYAGDVLDAGVRTTTGTQPMTRGHLWAVWPSLQERVLDLVSTGTLLSRQQVEVILDWGKDCYEVTLLPEGKTVPADDSPCIRIPENGDPSQWLRFPAATAWGTLPVAAPGPKPARQARVMAPPLAAGAVPVEGQDFAEDLGGGVTFEMVWVKSGKFKMGSPKSETGRDRREGPQREVAVPGFWMSKYEMTQKQYELLTGTNPSKFPGPDNPVEMISWNDAMGLCRKLSSKAGRTYTLPTEAQWEYACRAGTATPFSFGATMTTDQANFIGDYPYGGGRKGKTRKKTVAVGSFPPNVFGLYDMDGNVGEWCLSMDKAYPYREDDGRNDSAGAEPRVCRGGSWASVPALCRSAYRGSGDPTIPDSSTGIRVICATG